MDIQNRDIEMAIENLRNEDQIVSRELFGLIGNTKDGNTVWFPNSLQRGYADELTPVSQRPKMLWNLLGVVGYFSDGNFNYLPAYNQGKEIAKEVKITVLADQTWKITQKTEQQEQKLNQQNEQIKDLQNRLKDLERKQNTKDSD